MRVLKIECPECGSKAVIRKTNRKHREIADIYCACADVECGHTFVMNLTFSHTLSPSAKRVIPWCKHCSKSLTRPEANGSGFIEGCARGLKCPALGFYFP